MRNHRRGRTGGGGVDSDGTIGRAPDHQVERLVFFSDAVFAIAITLLVIEVHAPIVRAGSPMIAYWEALAHLIPNLVGFFVSFFVIGAFWAGHHRAFACAQAWSPRIVGVNLMMLCMIAAMPFFTAFMSDNPGAVVPTALYCFWLLLTAIANIRLQNVVLAPPVVREGIDPEHVATIKRRGLAVALGSMTAIGVSIVAPLFGQVALISIFLWRLVLDRQHAVKRAKAAATAAA
jgi:uncharacterized membrane protein